MREIAAAANAAAAVSLKSQKKHLTEPGIGDTIALVMVICTRNVWAFSSVG